MEGVDRGDEREPGTFEVAVQRIISDLENRFRPRFGSNLSEAKQVLHHLKNLNRLQLEGFYSRIMIVSFDDEAYARIQEKIKNLLAEVERCLSEHGLE
ncbi:MAG: hypothetical protein NTZ25_03730 [Candidatus Peregrinibacteria bacterium]|nr:hypothetical protein [Candidatus Peregrinibacteria bacterium]